MKHLIVIHGALGSADQMTPLTQHLSGHRSLHFLELYGHGSDSANTDPFEIDRFVEQLHRFLASLDGPKDVFGYSMGGFVALCCAAQGGQMDKIFTLGTKLHWTPDIAQGENKMLNPQKIEEKVPAFAQQLEARHGAEWKQVMTRTVDLLTSLGNFNPIDQTSMSAVPNRVNLLLGEWDEMVSRDETEQVAAWLPNGEFHLLPDSKHPFERVNLEKLASFLR